MASRDNRDRVTPLSRLDAIEQRWTGPPENLAQKDVLDLVAVARAAASFTGCWRRHAYLAQRGNEEPYRDDLIAACGECPGCKLAEALRPLLAEETT